MQPDAMRLFVRPVTPSDADDLFRIYGDPETNTFNPAGPHPDIHHSRDVLSRAISHLESHGCGTWAISFRDIQDVENAPASMLFSLSRNEWKQKAG